jgi:dTDP-4-amino-4,6-dideoxygalactose transaminase
MPMHTFGFPVHLEQFLDISTEWGIPLVEDAAEGLGSYYKGKHVGTFGLLGVFSFNGNKIITTGGGGMIVTNDDELANKAKHLTTTAKVPHPYEFYHDELGFNFRMPNLNAALGCAQLERLDEFLDAKRILANHHKNFFATLEINFKTGNTEDSVNYWLNTIELADKSDRDLLLRELNNRGIGCRPIWQLMFRLSMFSKTLRDHQGNAIRLEERIVNIPSSVPSTGNDE